MPPGNCTILKCHLVADFSLLFMSQYYHISLIMIHLPGLVQGGAAFLSEHTALGMGWSHWKQSEITERKYKHIIPWDIQIKCLIK